MSPTKIPNPVSNNSNIMRVISNIHYVLMNDENRRSILNCNLGVSYLENVEFPTPSRSPAQSTVRTAVFLSMRVQYYKIILFQILDWSLPFNLIYFFVRNVSHLNNINK